NPINRVDLDGLQDAAAAQQLIYVAPAAGPLVLAPPPLLAGTAVVAAAGALATYVSAATVGTYLRNSPAFHPVRTAADVAINHQAQTRTYPKTPLWHVAYMETCKY